MKQRGISLKNIRIFIVIFIVTGIFFSGCVTDPTNKPTEQASPSPTAILTSTASQTSTEAPQSIDQNKIKELENKINSMQQQINDLQIRLDRLGLPKPSNKSLIPRVPFRIEVKFGEMQTPTAWTFKETGEVEIRDASNINTAIERGTYRIFSDNNTIKINSKKYDFYGLVIYEDYATAIYENGWIVWVKKYQIFPPRYNSLTQKYELD